MTYTDKCTSECLNVPNLLSKMIRKEKTVKNRLF